MNDRAEVSAATRTLVWELSLAVSYTPDQSCRSLRPGTTDPVVMTICTDIGCTMMGEMFILGLCEKLQPALAEHGLNLVFLSCGSAAEQEQYPRRAVARRLADGFIISDAQRIDGRSDFLIDPGVPFVALGQSLRAAAIPGLTSTRRTWRNRQSPAWRPEGAAAAAAQHQGW